MLKLEYGHKIMKVGQTKAGSPYITIFIAAYDKPQVNGTNKKSWVNANVYFKQCNISNVNDAFNDKEINYAELGAYRFNGLDHFTPDNKSNETTYTFNIFADYVRFYKWDRDNKQEVNKNDKITYSNQSNYQPTNIKQEITDILGNDIQEEEFDWDADFD